jgi:hypothetical protein
LNLSGVKVTKPTLARAPISVAKAAWRTAIDSPAVFNPKGAVNPSSLGVNLVLYFLPVIRLNFSVGVAEAPLRA